MKLSFDTAAVARFCRSNQIARLEVFGSALRDDFNNESDLDLLATLSADAKPSLLDWVRMQDELTAVFGRPVDLISRRAVERSQNEIRRNSILSRVEPIYAEG